MEKEAQNHQGKIVVLTSQHIQSYFLTWNEVQWSGGEIELASIHLDLHLHHVVIFIMSSRVVVLKMSIAY